jgi:hypothetical protein
MIGDLKRANRGKTRLRGLRWCAAVACFAMLLSCASKKPEKTDYASMRFEHRISRQMKALHKGNEESIKSPFQQKVYNASRTVKTSEFNSGKGEFRSKKKGFFGSKDKFKAGTFSQADKSSRVGSQVFSGADDESRYGSTTFRTSQNRFNGKMSPSADQKSSMADEVYSTSGNPAALKNTSNSKMPLIERDTTYSEFEVRKLLNKG